MWLFTLRILLIWRKLFYSTAQIDGRVASEALSTHLYATLKRPIILYSCHQMSDKNWQARVRTTHVVLLLYLVEHVSGGFNERWTGLGYEILGETSKKLSASYTTPQLLVVAYQITLNYVELVVLALTFRNLASYK